MFILSNLERILECAESRRFCRDADFAEAVLTGLRSARSFVFSGSCYLEGLAPIESNRTSVGDVLSIVRRSHSCGVERCAAAGADPTLCDVVGECVMGHFTRCEVRAIYAIGELLVPDGRRNFQETHARDIAPDALENERLHSFRVVFWTQPRINALAAELGSVKGAARFDAACARLLTIIAGSQPESRVDSTSRESDAESSAAVSDCSSDSGDAQIGTDEGANGLEALGAAEGDSEDCESAVEDDGILEPPEAASEDDAWAMGGGEDDSLEISDEVIDGIADGLQVRQSIAPRELRGSRFMFDARRAKEGLRRWLTEELSKSDYVFLEKDNLLDLWDHLGEEHRWFADLSKVAIYVLSIPASSVAIERHIWRQRRALCPDRMRTSLRTEVKRTRLAACDSVPGLDFPWPAEEG